MEPKKNPKYDVHRQRGTIFQISMVITLVLVITVFKWRAPVEKVLVSEPTTLISSIMYDDIIPSTSIKTKEPPKAREIRTRRTNLTEFIIANTPLEDTSPSTPIVDQGEPNDDSSNFGPTELDPEISSDSVFIFVEKMPEPVGGYEGFYKYLSKNMKYPRRASRDDVNGKVFISFVVNEKSELSDFKVLKGIGYGCDEEAMRVIALSKWNAGKQRGRPVKVRMVQTINFQLN